MEIYVRRKKQKIKKRMPTSSIKYLLRIWDECRTFVLEWHTNQAERSRVRNQYKSNAICFSQPEKREKENTLE